MSDKKNVSNSQRYSLDRTDSHEISELSQPEIFSFEAFAILDNRKRNNINIIKLILKILNIGKGPEVGKDTEREREVRVCLCVCVFVCLCLCAHRDMIRKFQPSLSEKEKQMQLWSSSPLLA